MGEAKLEFTRAAMVKEGEDWLGRGEMWRYKQRIFLYTENYAANEEGSKEG